MATERGFKATGPTVPPQFIAFGNNNNNTPPRSPPPPISPNFPPSNRFPIQQPQQQRFNTSQNPSFQPQFPNFPRSPPPPPQQQAASYRPPRGFLIDSGGPQRPQQPRSLTWERNPSNNVSDQRPNISPPRWGVLPKSYSGDTDYQLKRGTSRNVLASTPAGPANFQGPELTRTPSSNKIYLDDFTQDVSERPDISPSRWGVLPKSYFGDTDYQLQGGTSHDGLASTPAGPAKFQGPERTRSPSSDKIYLDDFTQDVSARLPSDPSSFQALKKTRSSPSQSDNEIIWRNSQPSQGATNRIAASTNFGHTTTLVNKPNLTVQQKSPTFSPHNKGEGSGPKTKNAHVPKRNRSPSLASAEDHIPGTSYSSQDDTERETQAKAKRLARFGVELSQPMQRNLDHLKHKSPENRHDQTMMEKRKLVSDQPMEASGDFMLADNEGLEASGVITGVCPDMCPESEREERERKGDLDKYERLDGNRNQSSTFLAVKKYNRTAEREAGLIRPMPVLQQTIEYLLSLLDEPYDDRFLGMYNFLWDRMRAIRMDLRMQHIFDEDAIIMLEQMIRLHIIAMHELCEYTKGEGFSEGFNAHLNIEQMNKTSVELFQMYDDHRKKGNILASEKEFRGYYALLKLDKHPGYKVEPAELSLDLAKMTPEIRQTPEILFAREVARACRTGNFIAFFRLARKATYLQACLMHAHFAKLRTQALASLHSGLQNNQGIPIAQVTKWLGMEEEDIEGLLEYHGFLIMEFEEPYMVKEGIFLNSDTDYPTKCSQLVHLKKSRSIVEDVSSSIQSRLPTEHLNQILSDKTVQPDSKAISYVRSRPSIDVVDEVMEEDPVLMEGLPVHPLLERPSTGLRAKSDHQVAERLYSSSPQHSPRSALSKKAIGGKPVQETLQNVSVERTMHSPVPLVPRIFMTELPQQSERFESDPHLAEVLYVSSPQQSPKSAEAKVVEVVKPAREAHQNDSVERTLHSSAQSVFLMSVTERPQPNERSEGYLSEPWLENSAPHVVIGPPENDESFAAHQLRDEEAMDNDHELENEEYMEMVQQGIEVKMTKLKLIIRKWKRFSTRLKELREQRQLAAYAALNSLTLGPPIQQIEAPSSHVPELDLDRASRARHERHKKSWSRTNISEVVGGILSERNPDAKCLCWKLIVCSQPMPTEGAMSVQESRTNYIAGLWLHSKLMGDMKDNDDELVVSSPDLSIWSNWFAHQYNNSPVCCLSIIREEKSTMVQDVRGASGILFLLSETIPFDVQKTKLDNLLMLLPSGSCLPLLILCVTQKVGSTSIINGLSLHDLDKTRISNFSVGFIVGDQPPGHLDGFLSTERLIEGLQWLASESPVQPVVHGMNTHELVMEHVSSSLEMLENVDVSVVGPNHCISVFNEVLDRSATEIATTAKTNPSGWPCPEITMLKSSNEHSAVNTHLPHVGWSSDETIRPILKKFQDCRLPSFTNDLSWLSRGSDVGEEILHHKEQLENCLIRYLTDSSKMMDIALATTEACVVLQKGAQLELEGSKYFIKPKWASIFRRIFNWRLMNLSNGVDSVAYIKSDTAISLKSEVEELNMGTSFGLLGSDNSELEVYGSFPSSPSLDEMVEVCYNTFQYGKEQSKSEASVLSPRVANGEETLHTATDSDNIDEEGIPPGDLEPTITGDAYSFSSGLSRREVSVDHLSREVVLTKKSSTKEADKLSKLLEQCNIVQNKIDKQLSIYF